MVYIRSRKFCCCLPVRFGVFCISILGMALGGLISVGGWIATINEIKTREMGGRDAIALYIQTALYTVLAVTSLFGFVGVFIKRRSFIKLYSTILSLYLGISIASGAFYLYTIFHREKNTNIDKCIGDKTDDITKAFCKGATTTLNWVTVGLFVIGWLISLYGVVIVSNYVEQIEDEEAAHVPRAMTEAYAAATSPSITTYNSYGGARQYGFTAPQNSHGMGPSHA